MNDYAEYITEINRLKREIHDACLANQWALAMTLADRLKADAHALRVYCYDKATEAR